MKRLTNDQKIELILEDARLWNNNAQDDGSLGYALDYGYDLHAASLWLSSGALSENVKHLVKVVAIDSIEENKEIEQLIEDAYIYVCNDCNHHTFLYFEEGDSIECSCCSNTANLEKTIK